MVETVTVCVEEEISYAHRLQDHPGKCKTLHGHNALVKVSITGKVNEKTGMVVDFGNMKEAIKYFDHQTILQKTDPLHSFIKQVHPVIALEVPPTAENLARCIARGIALRETFDLIVVTFPETCGAAAEVRVEKDDD